MYCCKINTSDVQMSKLVKRNKYTKKPVLITYSILDRKRSKVGTRVVRVNTYVTSFKIIDLEARHAPAVHIIEVHICVHVCAARVK